MSAAAKRHFVFWCWTLVDEGFICIQIFVLNKVIIIPGVVTPLEFEYSQYKWALTVIDFLDFQEPSSKRVRPLAKVSSLVNLISPSKNGAVRRFGQTLQVKAHSCVRNLNEHNPYLIIK